MGSERGCVDGEEGMGKVLFREERRRRRERGRDDARTWISKSIEKGEEENIDGAPATLVERRAKKILKRVGYSIIYIPFVV